MINMSGGMCSICNKFFWKDGFTGKWKCECGLRKENIGR